MALVAPVLAQQAAARADAVRLGPSAATAVFDLDASQDALLAPGSDPNLRVKVYGDLEQAKRIAIMVPGVAHGPEEFDRPDPGPGTLPGRSLSLYEAAMAAAEQPSDVAVVAFLGYDVPDTPMGALSSRMIRPGAANLADFQAALAKAHPDAQVTWVCHSLGSLVCASALVGAAPDAVVLAGSPGVMVENAADLNTSAPIFAVKGPVDPIRLSAALAPLGAGFGEDPAASGFGAQSLPTEQWAGHSDYFDPGSAQLLALARIVTGDQRGSADAK
jgi:hypothetical protein